MIEVGMMKDLMIIFILITFLLACENNKGQYRHDTTHHKKTQQNMSD